MEEKLYRKIKGETKYKVVNSIKVTKKNIEKNNKVKEDFNYINKEFDLLFKQKLKEFKEEFINSLLNIFIKIYKNVRYFKLRNTNQMFRLKQINEKFNLDNNITYLTYKINLLLFKLLIFINLIFLANSQNRNLEYSNEITIKILLNDRKNILNSEFIPHPDEIYMNGTSINIDNENKITNIINGEKVITMKWFEPFEDCSGMFMELDNMIEVDFSNFDSSLVNKMDYMFFNCKSLISLNFSKFNTSKVTIINYLFYSCSSLTSLDLSNFDTSLVVSMGGVFQDCSSLKLLNVSNFNTSKVTIMSYMFHNCKELLYLDLSNFDTSSVLIMNNMFSGCNKLISLNISNLNTLNVLIMDYFFSNCTNLEFIDFSNFKEGIKFEKKDNIFEGIPDNFSYCIKNVDEMSFIMSELNNKNCSIIDCSNIWKTKQKKIISEKNKCVYDCSEDNLYSYTFRQKCYNECPYGTYLSDSNNKICSIICPEELPFEKNGECFATCDAPEFFNKMCILNNKTIQAKDYMINEIRNGIINKSMNLLLNALNEEKEDLIIKDINEIYQISTTYNQKFYAYDNRETTINLGECENLIKEEYEIEESLILFKMDYYLEGFLIPIIEYEIFNPLNNEKIDLTKCADKKITINISVSIDEEKIYKYDPFSEFYKNKCYPNISECEDDNILEERKNEFNNNNLSLCERNCIYKGYNIITKKVTCECDIKTNFINLSEILNKKKELLFHIIDVKNNSIENSDLVTNTFINSYINSVSISDLNLNKNLDINSNRNTEISSNINKVENCLFLEKISKECKELVVFEDLINEKYIPLNTKESINKVFELYSEELKRKKINRTENEIIK